jgi:uncharacterized protein (DUF2235 family)
MARRLALYLDGTTDTEAGNTNVWRLKSLCALKGPEPDNIEQKIFYSVGVGTARDETVRGGAFGYGIDDVVVAAYEWLIENYEEKDEVFIFGFSRGAYTARSLAGFISRCGVIALGAPVSIKQLYDRYRKGDDVKSVHELLAVPDKSHFDIEEQWVVKYCQPIDVKFTGVWDTVAALANSVHWSALTGGDHHFLDANLRKSERFVYHALAIDENRRIFDATFLTVYADKDKPFVQPRPIAGVEQRWFCGSHGNVGGGNYSDIAAQIPLQWLMKKAQAHGLVFRRDSIDIEPNADSAELYDSFKASDVPDALQRYLLQHGVRYWRDIDRQPEPRTRTIIHTVNESIDKSVFARCRTDPNYQPENLKAWAVKHGVTLTDIQTSVRADDPSVAVPD